MISAGQVTAQTTSSLSAEPEVRGIYNWIHSTAHGELTFPYYRDMLDIKLVRSPFAGSPPADAPAPQIRPVSEAVSDPLIWHLTDSEGSRFRNVFMHSANEDFGLELSEFFDIPRNERAVSPYDPGASRIIFHVRDLDEVVSRMQLVNTPVVTLGEQIIDTPLGRSILLRDPDGYLLQLFQASPAAITQANSPEQVIAIDIGLTVADTARSLRFYRDLLGFEVLGSREGSTADLRLNGLEGGSLRQTTTVIPGTEVRVILDEFAVPSDIMPAPRPMQWTIQDVGSPQFQLQVTNLDTLIRQTQEAGYDFLSWDAEPIQRNFGRFVFAKDPDGILVEYVEPRIQP
ncbi:MAG: hypothetical protein CMP91_06250 [Gammaproteobacteria bacterium]|nr:hypothetical protein [Gammaproteobacteria bacterium]|tara:strand:+ start:49217 stop:50248 length:1032 start_codon:yes stop_codon:yes gene_type:complete